MNLSWINGTTLSVTALMACFALAPTEGLAAPPLLAQAAPETGSEDSVVQAPPQAAPTESNPPAGEPEVLVAEVLILGTEDPALIREIYEAIGTQAGQTTTRTQLEEDINSVFSTGYFADVEALPSDTALGVRVTYEVRPNPIVRSIRAENTTVLPDEVVGDLFGPQAGETLNFSDLQLAVEQLEAWYAEQGFVLASVKDVRSTEDGDVVLEVAEGVIEDIRVAGNDRTRDFIVTREMELEPGQVFNRNTVQTDLQNVFALNLFQDVNLSLEPGDNPDNVVATVNVEERNTGSLSAGGGLSSGAGIFGTLSISQQNLGGNNQRLGLDIQVGTEELLFDVGFTDPRIAHWETPTSLNVNAFNRFSSDRVFDDDQDIVRLGSAATLARPISENWRASLGVQQQFVSIRDRDDDEPLTLDGDTNSLSSVRFGVVRDLRDDPILPSRGNILRLSTDQSIAGFILNDGLTRNRAEVSYSHFIPVNFLKFEGRSPEVLAFDVRSGSIFGDTAPFDSFLLGGANSVRGFDEGRVGTSQSFALASAEYRFPVFNFIGGALFADYGTDLGTADGVFGNPTDAQGLLGSAFGIGAGVRVQSPVGAIRVDYGIGQGEDSGRVHFGFGEKF
ncbi:BamA/TamA family outer membrane protein [Synechococcus sp. PCC 7336]|uniref:BamA/TamA family outer membrane protein n=1 Tax=Synechococcus sp. PCC 7336 TaxID=195250 RepID=UPI00034CC1F8|nr:BamA/TamA family outer membrane protein [Synechococcus sp. PCC 7336]